MEQQETPTWTVVIVGPFFWGAGNSHKEAFANAKEAAPTTLRKTDEYSLYLFTRPVKNVYCTPFSLNWEWAGEEGERVHALINEKGDQS